MPEGIVRASEINSKWFEIIFKLLSSGGESATFGMDIGALGLELADQAPEPHLLILNHLKLILNCSLGRVDPSRLEAYVRALGVDLGATPKGPQKLISNGLKLILNSFPGVMDLRPLGADIGGVAVELEDPPEDLIN